MSNTRWKTLAVFAVCSPYLYYIFMPIYARTRKSDKTVIVTGATGMLGRSLSRNLAAKQCRVIMASRDMEKCKILRREIILQTRNKNVVCRKLDLEDIDSIDDFAKQITEKETYVDALIHNAAIKEMPEKELTKYGIEKMFFVNYMAPFYLTEKLKDKMLQSADVTGDARVIMNVGKLKPNYSVDLHDINFDKRKWTSQEAYGQSKLALGFYTILLDEMSKNNFIDLYAYATNPVAETILDSHTPNHTILEQLKYDFLSIFYLPSIYCVQTMLMLAIDPEVATRKYSGKFYSWCLSYWGLPKVCKDKSDEGKRIWNHTVDLLDEIDRKRFSKPKKEDNQQEEKTTKNQKSAVESKCDAENKSTK